jgi:predicted AAA+ superfamily ATPase
VYCIGITIEAGNTLIILDEIQEAKGALTSLKYFQENAPEYHIISAGSLLGVALNNHTSFPVGKVELRIFTP